MNMLKRSGLVLSVLGLSLVGQAIFRARSGHGEGSDETDAKNGDARAGMKSGTGRGRSSERNSDFASRKALKKSLTGKPTVSVGSHARVKASLKNARARRERRRKAA